MKLTYFLLLFVFCGAQSPTDPSDGIIGTWRLENSIDLEIYKSGPKYSGKIAALNGFNDGQTLDSHNSDKERQNDPLVGKVILTNLSYNTEEGIWENGKMYAPHMGFFANLEIKEVAGNEITAVGSKFLFWHAETWTRQ